MSFWLDFMDMFNLIDRIEGLLARFSNADYAGAAKRSGGIGVAAELTRSALGTNSWTFQVRNDTEWTGDDIERYLRRYGVMIWGRRVTGRHLIFSVKKRQADWAEYLMMRRGILLEGRTFNRLNEEYRKAHAPGDSPPAWADQKGRRR